VQAQSASALRAFGRELREEDLVECLAINPARIGEELVGSTQAVEIWKRLIRSRSFNSTVIEAARCPKGHRIVFFGSAVFVSQAFAEAEFRTGVRPQFPVYRQYRFRPICRAEPSGTPLGQYQGRTRNGHPYMRAGGETCLINARC
jgi:hypothetical protein